MRQVDKYISLYRQNKITLHQVYKKLGGRKYKEWWDKVYKEVNEDE